MEPIRIAIMVSGQGRGSNMQNIIDGCTSGKINGKVVLIIGVNENSPAIMRAKEQNIKTISLSPSSFSDRNEYDQAIFKSLLDNQIDLICLAGYMTLLGNNIVKHFSNRIMNVHPALIPSFSGKGMYGHHVHEAVINRGVKFTGATVHFVNEEYDKGPIIIQRIVDVDDEDTPDTIAAKVLKEEHIAYADAVALFAKNLLEVNGSRVRTLKD